MKITGKYHITATEKKHIKQIIANGWLEGATKIKSYKMEKTATGFSGKVFTTERNDFGKKIVREQSFTVEMERELA